MKLQLFNIDRITKFPSTRYQGSKAKYLDWIWYCIKDLSFNMVLDAFGGTGCVGYMLKQNNKQITYNDILPFNSIIGKALIENSNQTLEDYEVDILLKKNNEINYPDFIENTFHDIYFTDDENRWLDVVATNIRNMDNAYKQAIAWFALFQSCIIKRPYNLFHRKNLYIRTQEVKRSFGNKVTWDTPFEIHFRHFVNEANEAVFDNGKINQSINKNIFDINNHFDLIYIDTPYISEKGVGVDYADFYHFLNGICQYDHWKDMIDYSTKHKRLKRNPSEWCDSTQILESFKRLIHQFKESILVVSYRSDGIPSINDIQNIMLENGKKVQIFESREIKYVLSNKNSTEMLIVGS